MTTPAIVQKPRFVNEATPGGDAERDHRVERGRKRAGNDPGAEGQRFVGRRRDGATIPVDGDRPALGVRERMPDELCLCLNQPADAAIAEWEQAAELVHHFVGVETNGAGVIADEGAGEDPRRPPRKVVPFEPVPEVPADLGHRSNGLDRNAPALTLSAKSGPECIPVGHEKALKDSKSRAGAMPLIPAVLSSSGLRTAQFCNL